MPTDYSRRQECAVCGRLFHPSRWDARNCNDCGGNERHPLVDEDGEDDGDV